MAYDELLSKRVAAILEGNVGLQEKKMFGGVGYLLNGNMACGVNKNNLIVRVGPQAYAELLTLPHVNVFDMTGRPMTGWVCVAPQGCQTDSDLARWVALGVEYVSSLPPK